MTVEMYTKDDVDLLLSGASIGAPPFQFFNKRHNWSSQIFRAGSRLSDLTTDFAVSMPSIVWCMGYVNFKHRNIAPGAVFASTNVGIRSAATLANLPTYPTGARSEPLWNNASAPLSWIPGAKDGGNIRDVTQHYLTLRLDAVSVVEPGAHRIEAWCFSGTDSAGFTTRDDLIEVNRDTGQQESNTFGFLATLVMPMAS